MSLGSENDVATRVIPAIVPVPEQRRPAAAASTTADRRPSAQPDHGIGSFPSQAELVSTASTSPARLAVLLVAVAVGTLVSVGLGV
jgi:hypothetical protein